MIKMLVMDVDGTLTDGKLYIGSNEEMFKAFDVKDGYGIYHLPEWGIIPVIITGRESEIVKTRAKELRITELYQGVSDKRSVLKEVAARYHLDQREIAYIGDDVNDLGCMEYCGITACPKDALEEVQEQVHFISRHNGGDGAVREFIEYLKKINSSGDE